MFDINAVINTAINSAVDQSLLAVKQEHLNAIGALAQEIVKLQDQLATLAEKTAAVAGQVQPTIEGMDLRKIIRAELMDLLTGDDDVQQKLHGIARSVADEAVSDHCDEYDHDSYDEAASAIEDLDVDELVKAEDLRSEVKEIMEGASLSVSF